MLHQGANDDDEEHWCLYCKTAAKHPPYQYCLDCKRASHNWHKCTHCHNRLPSVAHASGAACFKCYLERRGMTAAPCLPVAPRQMPKTRKAHDAICAKCGRLAPTSKADGRCLACTAAPRFACPVNGCKTDVCIPGDYCDGCLKERIFARGYQAVNGPGPRPLR